MRSMHYYIKLAVVCASLGLTAIFGQAQEIAERNLSPLHWRYDVRVKRSADGKKSAFFPACGRHDPVGVTERSCHLSITGFRQRG